jgi:hypothetical protein
MFLLRRNWFIDRQGVHDLLDELPEDVYYEVLDRRHELPSNVQEYFGINDMPPTKMVVSDISDTEWEQMEMQKEEVRLEKIKKRKNAFVPPPRPREVIDDLLDYAETTVQKKQNELDGMLRGRTFRQRNQEEHPAVRDTRAQLEILKNELELIKSKMVTHERLWTELSFLDAALSGVGVSRETS